MKIVVINTGSSSLKYKLFNMEASNQKAVVIADGIRESTPEGLGKLRTVFSAVGSVTAGNSSQTTDGAAATIIASKEKCDELGFGDIP